MQILFEWIGWREVRATELARRSGDIAVRRNVRLTCVPVERLLAADRRGLIGIEADVQAGAAHGVERQKRRCEAGLLRRQQRNVRRERCGRSAGRELRRVRIEPLAIVSAMQSPAFARMISGSVVDVLSDSVNIIGLLLVMVLLKRPPAPAPRLFMLNGAGVDETIRKRRDRCVGRATVARLRARRRKRHDHDLLVVSRGRFVVACLVRAEDAPHAVDDAMFLVRRVRLIEVIGPVVRRVGRTDWREAFRR